MVPLCNMFDCWNWIYCLLVGWYLCLYRISLGSVLDLHPIQGPHRLLGPVMQCTDQTVFC